MRASADAVMFEFEVSILSRAAFLLRITQCSAAQHTFHMFTSRKATCACARARARACVCFQGGACNLEGFAYAAIAAIAATGATAAATSTSDT